MLRSLTFALFVPLILASGCTPSFKPYVLDNPMPTRGEVEALEAEPVPEVTIAQDGVYMKRWALAGPFPDMIGMQKRRPVTPLDEVVSGFTGGATVTEQMTCATRELGRFFLANGDYPATHIEEFILARCGTLSDSVQSRYVTWPAPADGVARAEEVLVREAFDMISEVSSELGARERGGELGGWMGRHEDGRTFAFVSVGFPDVDLEPVSMIADPNGLIVFEGRVRGDSHDSHMYVTRDAYGSEACLNDDRVRLPRFRYRCQMSPDDVSARMRLSVSRRRTSAAANALFFPRVWRKGHLPREYGSSQHEQLAAAMNVGSRVGTTNFPEEFVGMVNALRKTHDLTPLLHSEAQTRTVQRLTPAYYDSNEDAEDQRIIGSIRAGWGIADVDIVNTHFVALHTPTDDPRALVSMLADDPRGREVLFHEGEAALAIGTIPQGETSYVFVCSYEFLPDMTHRERIIRVQRILNAKRKLAGKGKMRRYKNFYDLADELAADITAGRRDPNEAAAILGDEVQKTLNKGVYWYTMYRKSLDHFTFPEDLVESDPLHGAILVAPFRAEGQRHTGYFIMVVYPMEHSAER